MELQTYDRDTSHAGVHWKGDNDKQGYNFRDIKRSDTETVNFQKLPFSP